VTLEKYLIDELIRIEREMRLLEKEIALYQRMLKKLRRKKPQSA
jgi:hypothetical protein